MDSIQEIIEIIKKTIEEDSRVKKCYKFQSDKDLQIQLHNGNVFNLILVKLDNGGFVIKRTE